MNPPDARLKDRDHFLRRIEGLRAQGICYQCHDLATGGDVFGDQPVVYEDELFKVVLDPFPRMRGHTIVVYKPHRQDISELTEDEAGSLAAVCVRVIKAIKTGLGAERVYLATMCDGEINHLHVQLFPRYAGDPIGSKRFIAERAPLTDGTETTRLIRTAMEAGDPNARSH